MTQQYSTQSFPLLKSGLCALSIALSALFAAGCGSDQGGGGGVSAPASEEAHIAGNVQDQHGPIMDGKVEVHDKNGKLIVSTPLSGNSNHYNLTVPAGTLYPIVLTATPPANDVVGPVKAVVTSPLADRMDITDVTTIVVDSALTLGGLTAENIAKASGAAIGLRQREGVSAGAGGGGSGAGQSAGGVSRGGHGGHDMSGMGGGSGSSGGDSSMEGMQH
ncbi:hypothetical protein [Methylomagnum ishizawai]|uniref:hypothetical protein n=1 Tax=Methylomagnum ishizawai TaxID=1760988 RepID=UPI001C32F002|nr:hypothetical protein [Methylomagnum ishizawai]BBL77017.1 hypothetical protein MishRS11D_41150 [Methylomagnum ishizawai]